MNWLNDGQGGVMPRLEFLRDGGPAHRWNTDLGRAEFWHIYKGCWVKNKRVLQRGMMMHGQRCGFPCPWLVQYEDTWAEPVE